MRGRPVFMSVIVRLPGFPLTQHHTWSQTDALRAFPCAFSSLLLLESLSERVHLTISSHISPFFQRGRCLHWLFASGPRVGIECGARLSFSRMPHWLLFTTDVSRSGKLSVYDRYKQIIVIFNAFSLTIWHYIMKMTVHFKISTCFLDYK